MWLQKKCSSFWFQPQTSYALSCFRIAVGVLAIYSLMMMVPLIEQFFTSDGVLPTSALNADPQRQYYSILFWVESYYGVLTVLLVGVLTSLFFASGYGLPWASILLYIIYASFHDRNPFVFSGAEHLLRIFLFFFMFAPWKQSIAFGSKDLLPASDSRMFFSPPWAQRMLQIQVTVVYLSTGIAKVSNELWRDGSAVYYVFGQIDFNKLGIEQLMNYPLLWMFFTYASLVAELAIAIMLWWRRTRLIAIGLGVGLHLWMICFMTIPLFSPLLIASYVLFLSEDECRALAQRLKRVTFTLNKRKSLGYKTHDVVRLTVRQQ